MTRVILLFCYIAVVILSADATPVGNVKNTVEGVKNVEVLKEGSEVVSKVQDQPETQPAPIERIDEDLPSIANEEVGVQNDKGDLETANTFWGGYYRVPSWGWRRGWGNGGNWGYVGWPSSGYGWGGRGFNNWGWGVRRGWNGGYWWR